MAERKTDMAIAFIHAYPQAAARALEQQAPEAIAALISSLPEDEAAQLLRALLPHYAAKLVGHLEADLISRLLAATEPAQAVIILRHMPGAVRKTLVEAMPVRAKAACLLLLNYAEGTVGAWMNSMAFTLPEDCSVAEALQRLAAESELQDTGPVHVLSSQRHVRGVVQLPKLIGAAAELPLSSLWEAPPEALQGRATLLSVRDNPLWISHDSVPVLNRHKQFVGTLSHARLRQGIAELASTMSTPAGSDPVSGISEVYGGSMLAVLESLGEASGLWKRNREDSKP